MQNIFRSEFSDKTVIAVAHRLDSIIDFDRIILMDQGVMLEKGSPIELLAGGTKFRALWDSFHADTDNSSEEKQH